MLVLRAIACALIFLMGLPLYSYAEPLHYSTMPSAQYVTPQTVKQWKKEGKKFTLVDVREPGEYAAGHLDGAINVQYLDVEKAAKQFDHTQPYIFYCTLSAWRAPYAANALADLGFANSYILQGGITAWREGGQIIYANDANTKATIAPYPEALAKILYHNNDRKYPKKINLTRKELKNFDGLDGHPAYVAVNGVIYDLTQSRLWRGGVHAPSKGRAMAGNDLTEVIKDSPHGEKHLKDFPVVGWLVN